MKRFCQRRTWFWVAVAAIVIAVMALLVPHVAGGHEQPVWLAILPVFFIGLIVPLSLAPLPGFLSLDRAPEPPALAPSFQRPPPLRA